MCRVCAADGSISSSERIGWRPRMCSSITLGLSSLTKNNVSGVEVKERLKQLRATVDILTMTATPIPRTLHMSLVGVRDISNLETPPEDRVAIETQLSRFDRGLIRRAVLRELNREGQVFFVHNRVQDIQVVAEKLKQIVPEATVEIAHGQMPEDHLEQVMVDFVAHRFDLLLATTIVESGLDIPNANTIFIDEADRYGLADLHQLRGRVGRYKHRAYCYLLIDQHKHLTPNAAKRLRAIEEFSEMGAGFALSMRDLEIRGAGNLLGHQQSGHIAAVGYEFYCQLLETAVRSLKKIPRRLSVDVDLDLPGTAYFPDDYVPDMRLKIDLYRRLRRAASYDELREYREELVDRFGTPSEPVNRLLDLAELRLDAARWQITSVYLEDRYLVLAFADSSRMRELQNRSRRKLRIVDGHHAYSPLEGLSDRPPRSRKIGVATRGHRAVNSRPQRQPLFAPGLLPLVLTHDRGVLRGSHCRFSFPPQRVRTSLGACRLLRRSATAAARISTSSAQTTWFHASTRLGCLPGPGRRAV